MGPINIKRCKGIHCECKAILFRDSLMLVLKDHINERPICPPRLLHSHTWTPGRVDGLQLHQWRLLGIPNPLGNKCWSWVRVDSAYEIPLEILRPDVSDDIQLQLQQSSLYKLRSLLISRQLLQYDN